MKWLRSACHDEDGETSNELLISASDNSGTCHACNEECSNLMSHYLTCDQILTKAECGCRVKKREKLNHLLYCTEPVRCQNCEEFVPFHELENHRKFECQAVFGSTKCANCGVLIITGKFNQHQCLPRQSIFQHKPQI
jgi:hypothetical protein